MKTNLVKIEFYMRVIDALLGFTFYDNSVLKTRDYLYEVNTLKPYS